MSDSGNTSVDLHQGVRRGLIWIKIFEMGKRSEVNRLMGKRFINSEDLKTFPGEEAHDVP